jgi:hypothetical protein
MNVAVSWYQKDEWEKMKALSVDAETLDDDYESWKKNANELIASLQKMVWPPKKSPSKLRSS